MQFYQVEYRINDVHERIHYVNTRLFTAFITIFLFLLSNPFFAFFILSLISIKFQPPKILFLLLASFSFAFFFYSRKYGISWANNSAGDDVPNYILLYNSNLNITFSEIFTRFFDSPGDNEPLWHLLFWVLLNFFHCTTSQFIFIHYLIIFLLLFSSFQIISKKYYIVIALAYFFLTPGSIDSIFHIWRQQLSFSIFLLGTVKFLIQKKNLGLLLILFTPFVHLVALFFVIIFFIFIYFKSRKMYKNKKLTIIFILIVCISMFSMFNIVLTYISSLNLDRVLIYLAFDSGENLRQIIVMLIFLILILITFYFFNNDDWNNYIFFITFILSLLTTLLPSASSIINRITYFSIPFLGIYFVKWVFLNFKLNKLSIIIFFIFFTGLIRVYPLITNKIASMQYLAFEHPLDPFMGIIKLLILNISH